VSKEIFRNLMHDLFVRLQSTRKRVIVKRQLLLLENLLNTDGPIEFFKLADSVIKYYGERKIPYQAIARDINKLMALGAVRVTTSEAPQGKQLLYHVQIVLDWPSTITDTEFFTRLAKLPKSKTYAFLSV
jgi:hypothetical protein